MRHRRIDAISDMAVSMFWFLFISGLSSLALTFMYVLVKGSWLIVKHVWTASW